MRVLTALATSLVTGSLVIAGFTQADDGGNRKSLAGRVFYVEATVLSSPWFPEYEGAVIQSCFTFQEDGAWIDLEWPGEGLDPIPGVWVQHDESPFINFTTYATWPDTGWTLVENGVVSLGQRQMKGALSTYGMVFAEGNELIFYVSGEGHNVDTCPL